VVSPFDEPWTAVSIATPEFPAHNSILERLFPASYGRIQTYPSLISSCISPQNGFEREIRIVDLHAKVP
jgi:hypothetical protein